MNGSYGLLLQSIGFLLLIVVLAYLAVRYGLRSIYRGFDGGYMKVLERVPLDPKSGSALTLIQVGREIYLVGSSQGSVTLLKTIDWKDLQYTSENSPGKSTDLRDSFSKIMQGLRKGGKDG